MNARGGFYGTAGYGPGINAAGIVYEITNRNGAWTLATLTTFSCSFSAGGAGPVAGVTVGPSGILYGTTEYGKESACQLGFGWGTAWGLRPGPNQCGSLSCPLNQTILHFFSSTGPPDGAYPGYGNVIFDHAGNMYGTTEAGYLGGIGGTVYELMPSSGGWTENTLHSFGAQGDGTTPYAGVIFDTAGNLYGTTRYGGTNNEGTVYKLTFSPGAGWSETVLYNFQNAADGAQPISGLVIDRAGNLYGATSTGGSGNGNGGTVFELSPSPGGSYSFSLLYSLAGPGGTDNNPGPWGSLVMDEAGNLYGTTWQDGAFNAGNVFKLTPSGGSWIYTSLHDFTGGNDGGYPLSSVTFDAAGNLYGTTEGGGLPNCNTTCGVIWEITP